jgi:hypothetical protein
MARFNSAGAYGVLKQCGIDWRRDFHSLRSEQVEALIAWADEFKYRKPRNANGSRARYFHAYLVRTIEAENRKAYGKAR